MHYFLLDSFNYASQSSVAPSAASKEELVTVEPIKNEIQPDVGKESPSPTPSPENQEETLSNSIQKIQQMTAKGEKHKFLFEN